MTQVFILQSPPNFPNSLLILAKIEAIVATTNQYSPATHLSNQGSLACRRLLQQLFFANASDFNAHFDETHFPYRLTLPKNFENFSPQVMNFRQNTLSDAAKMADSYYVSFSHSQNHMVILLSNHAKLGVDIEDKLVSQRVSQRYFLPHEIDWVQSLPSAEQAMGRKLLWTLKESLIKAQNSKNSQLMTGLKINLFDYLTLEQATSLIQPIADTMVSDTFTKNAINDFNYIYTLRCLFGFSPCFQCGFYLGFD